MVEMTAFNTIPHLMTPIVTETRRAVQILEWATIKMDERYALLAEARVKNIGEFNALGTEEIVKRFEPVSPDEEAKIPKKLPYVVIIIDELADLMMTAAKEIEGAYRSTGAKEPGGGDRISRLRRRDRRRRSLRA